MNSEEYLAIQDAFGSERHLTDASELAVAPLQAFHPKILDSYIEQVGR